MKKAVVALLLMLGLAALCPKVGAQGCHPSSSATLSPFDSNTWAVLTPDQIPAGTPYVQFTLTTPDGAVNHTVDVTNNTTVVWTWNVYNAPAGSSVSSFFTENGGPSQNLGINTFSGQSTSTTPLPYWQPGNYWDSYIELFDSSGNIIAVDHVRTTVSSGTSGTVNDEDEQSTTLFLSTTGSMGGNTGMNSSYCPGAGVARHNTDVRIAVTNLNTNELRSTYNKGSSVPALSNDYINSTTTTIVAFLPGDQVKIERTGRVFCTIAFFFGIVMDINGINSTSGDKAVVQTFRTKSVKMGKLGPGAGPVPNDTYYTVGPWCINTENPTFDPTKVGIPTTDPANAWNNGYGPGWFNEDIIGVSSPTQPGWNFQQYTLHVYPAKWLGGGWCTVRTAPY